MNARVPLTALGASTAAALIAIPLVGWPPVTRLPAVLVPAAAIAACMVRPWRWDQAEWQRLDEWRITRRQLAWTAVVAFGILFWVVFTRFKSGEINAVDFTVYFDRPLFQTAHGRPLWVETADAPGFSSRSELAVHAFWALFAFAPLYRLHATPLWLLAASVAAIVAGAVHLHRIMRRLGARDVLACATAAAFLLNANSARAVTYGFHPELLYAWSVPWMIDAALGGARLSFVCATLTTVAIKEDAVLPIVAVAVALLLTRRRCTTTPDTLMFVIVPVVVALVNLTVYYRFVVPALVADGRPAYSAFWANYGATPVAALGGMLSHPGRVATDVWSSGFFSRVLPPHAFLPLLSWEWMPGIIPAVVIFGTSANAQLRAFGIYYSMMLVPFLVVAASVVACRLGQRLVGRWNQLAAALAIITAAVAAGASDAGYSLRPWRAEVAAVPAALQALSHEPTVLVQSGLYPHAGYSSRVRLLTSESLTDAPGAAVVLAAAIGGYPLTRDDVERLGRLPHLIEKDGVVVVRSPGAGR